MVAVVTGSGLGLFTTGSVSGNANSGRGADRVYVNTATGNLVIQGVDETLSALGLDVALVRTYNSQGLLNDDNADNWRLGVDAHLSNLTGTVNTAGSTITKQFGDGARVNYAYVAARSRYETTDGDGAHDFLTYTGGTWTWTDGSSRNTETYDSSLRIATSSDADGNSVTYHYDGSHLVRLDMAGSAAQSVYLDYSGSNLSAIRVVSDGVTQTLTRYGYDGANRLQTVTVDLTPDDNSISDNATYVTTYGYDGSSHRVASVTQSDGSSVAFTYELIDSDYRLHTVTDGEGRVTTFTYTDASATGGATPTTVNSNGAVLSTTETQTTTTTHQLDEGAALTQETTSSTNDYSLNAGAVTQPSMGWVGPETRFTPSNAVNDPRIGFDSSGNAIAVWRADSNVYAQRYDRATDAWGALSILDSQSAAVGAVRVNVDATGNALAVWVQSFGTANSLFASRFDSTTGAWGAATLLEALDPNPVSTTLGNVAVSIRGANAAVAWAQSDGTRNNLYAALLTSGTWSSPQLLETSTNAANQPAVAIDGSGNVAVLWQQSDGTANSVYESRYSASAGTWSAAALFESSTTAINDPRVAFDSAGNGVAIWREAGNLFARRYTASTNTWAAQVAVDNRTNTVNSPELAIDLASGNAVAVWVQSDGVANSTYASVFTASTGTWSTATTIESSSNGVATATGSVAVSMTGGNIVASWVQQDGNLYAARYVSGSWSGAQVIDNAADVTAQPAVAIDSSGNVTALWQQTVEDSVSVVVNRFTASSGTWGTASVRPTPAGTVNDPRIVFDGSGNAIAIWRAYNNLYAQRFDHVTGTWGALTVLDSRSATVNAEHLSVDSAGNAIAAWVQSDGTVASVYASLFNASTGTWSAAAAVENLSLPILTAAGSVVTSINNGKAAVAFLVNDGVTDLYLVHNLAGSWSTPELLDANDPFNASQPAVSITDAGDIFLLWRQSDTGSTDNVYFQRYTASAGTWSGAYYIDPNPISAADPRVQTDAAGNAMAVWREGGDVYALRYDFATGTVQPPVLLDVRSNTVQLVELAMDRVTGNAVAVWVQSNGTANSVYASNYTASTQTWSTATLLENSSLAVATAASSLVVSMQGGRAAVAWLQTDGTRNNLWVARYAAGAWSAPESVESNNNPAAQPSIAIDATGSVAVMWQQSDGNNLAISVNRYASSGGAPYYTIQTGDTWPSIAGVLYGINNAAAGAALQAALGSPALTAGNQLTGFPATLSVTTTTTTTVPPYYVMDGDDTWSSVALLLYGSAAVAGALSGRYGNVPAANGLRLDDLPAAFDVTTTSTITVPAYYIVQANQDWDDIALAVYGTDDPNAVLALMQARPGVTLSTGLHLDVPASLTFTPANGGTSTLYRQTDIELRASASAPVFSLTTVTQDAAGRLASVLSPAVGGNRLETRYGYDADGNLTSTTEDPNGINRVTAMSYDANGNLVSTRDALGDTITRTYDSSNQLVTETRYVVPDPDGAGAGAPSIPLTSRFAYDAENHLRFSVSATGRVIEHRYNAAGQRVATLTYGGATYDVSSLGVTATLGESTLAAWAAAQNQTTLLRTDYAYDFRGNVETTTSYEFTDATGAGSGPGSVTRFVYDQRGRLLTTIEARGTASAPADDYLTSYVYDGLGRVLSTASWVSGTTQQTTSNFYDDAQGKTSVTLASGVVVVSTYDRAGELVSTMLGSSGEFGTTTYSYDAAGRLRMATDPLGVRTYNFYDAAGRLAATVDGDGTYTEFAYDRTSALVKTTQYAVRLDATTLASLVSANVPQDVPLATLRDAADGVPADDRISRRVYDTAGRLELSIDAAGAVIKYTYDGAGRVVSERHFSTPVAIDRAVDVLTSVDVTLTSTSQDRLTRHFFDDDGNEVATLDAAGYLVEYVRDPAGFLAMQIGYAVRTAAQYWQSGTLSELRPATDANDVRSRFFHDAQGRQIGVLDSEGYFTETVYDVAGHVTSTTRYDVVLDDAAGTATFATLRAAAQAAVNAPVNPAIAHTTSFEYDGIGRVTRTVDFEGTETLSEYDAAGNLVRATRAAGTTEARRTETRYDALGRVVQELSAEGSALITGTTTPTDLEDIWSRYGVRYTYDLDGRRISATSRPDDTRTLTTLYFYDDEGRLRFEVNPDGEVRETRYDAFGQATNSIAYTARISTASLVGGAIVPLLTDRVAAAANPSSDAVLTRAYTLRGQIAHTQSAEGAITDFEYDAFGDNRVQLSKIDATRTLRHEYTYDARGQLVETRWDPTGFNTVETRTYDAFGRVVSVTDARNATTSFEYDRLGRQLVTTDALNARSSVSYDAFGRTLTVTDALGKQTAYTYDDDTRTMTVTSPEGIVVETEHNRHGQTLRVIAAGLTSRYSYDAAGRLIESFDNIGTREISTYDRAGRVKVTTYISGATTTFTYDGASRVLTRTVAASGDGIDLTTQYEYDGQGRVFRVTEDTGRVTETEYDRDGRVKAVTIDPSGLALRTEYDYDVAGHTIEVREGVGGTPQFAAGCRRTVHDFDVLGRRIRDIVDPFPNRQYQETGLYLHLVTEYRYDANGNLTRKIDAEQYSTWFVYDAKGQLRFTVDAAGGVSESVYDAAGRVVETRRYATADSTYIPETGQQFGAEVTLAQLTPRLVTSAQDRRTRSVYDGDGREVFSINGLGGVTERTYDANGNVTRTRLYALPVAFDAYATPGAVRAALVAAGNDPDALGANDRVSFSVYDVRGRAVYSVDGLGAVTRMTYDAAGNVASTTAFADTRDISLPMTRSALDVWAAGSSIAGNPSNRTTRHWYDQLDRLRFTLDAEGYLKEMRYDDEARKDLSISYAARPDVLAANATLDDVEAAVNATPGADVKSETWHDVAGRVTRVYDSLGNYDAYGYDALGNKISFRNKLGRVWTYEYDANRRLISETTPNVEIATIALNGDYDPFSTSVMSVDTSTAAIVTRFQYDKLGNVRNRIEASGRPEQRVTTYEYDQLGRQVRTMSQPVGIYAPDLDGVLSQHWGYGYGYNGNFDDFGAYFGRQRREDLEEIFPLFSDTFYDTLGNAIAGSDGAGDLTRNFYDRLGRLRFTIDAESYVTEYRYDTFGNQIELVRYAHQIVEDPNTPLSSENLASFLTTDAANDRKIVTEYDRMNRATRVTEPEVLAFEAATGAPGGTTFTASPTTASEYDAFGQLVKQSRLVNPLTNQWADTYFYYDDRGLKTAEIDPLGYLTTFRYDAQGNLEESAEFAKALQGTWSTSSHGNAPPAAAGDAAGLDRVTQWEYDSLNRRTVERRVAVVHSTLTGAVIGSVTENAETLFGYDLLGNLTAITNPAGAITLNKYDDLGRKVGTIAPTRDGGDGTQRTPVLRLRYDAFGNVVEQTLFANDSSGPDPFAVTASSADRVSITQYDALDRAIRRQDATGVSSFVSYTARGDVGREWHAVSGDGGVSINIHEYDHLGRLVRTTTPHVALTTLFESTRNDLEFKHTNNEYNAFGEVVRRDVTATRWVVDPLENVVQEESGPLASEYFEYDHAGRLVKTNSGTGVDTIQLYDLAGRATASITSQTRELRDVSVAAANALTTERMRTETRYDLAGRVVEQRLPNFDVQNPDSELRAIGALLRIGDSVLGPNNPDAVYQVSYGSTAYDADGLTDYEAPFLRPEQTVFEGGGWRRTPPTEAVPGGGWTLDSSYALEAGRYIHWTRPPEFTVDNDGRSRIVFEIRPASGGSWTPLRVVALPGNEVGVKLDASLSGEFDYRLTYTAANATQPYAIATGHVALGTSSTLADTTAATIAGEGLAVTAFESETATNTQFKNAGFRIGDFLGLIATDSFVYRRVVTGAIVEYVVDRQATVAQGGGYYRTASGYVQKTDYLPATSRLIRWDAPASGSYAVTFSYRAQGGGEWQTAAATLAGGVYSVAVGNLDDGHYEYRVTYSPAADPAAAPVATANGVFQLEAATESPALDVTTDAPDDAGRVAAIGNRPPGGLSVTGEIVSSAQLEDANSTSVLFDGTNDVLVTFASTPGPVRIELEYVTLPIAPENDPGQNGNGWPSQTRHISLLLADGTNAASGLHVSWTDPTAYLTTGGISQISSIRVYSVAADGAATLRHSTIASELASLGGTQLSWKAPWNTAVVATFNVRAVGTTTWQALAVSRVSGDYTVDVGAFGYGSWEYEVTYTLDGVTRAQSTGVFSTQGGRISNVDEGATGGVYPREAFPPVTGLQTAPVTFTVTSAQQVVTGTPMYGPLTTAWAGTNQVAVSWPQLNTGHVRVVVDYTSAERYVFNHAGVGAPSWQTSAEYVPGVPTSHTQEFYNGAFGASVSWEDDDAGSVGGISAVHRVRVYAENAGNWELRYDFDADAPKAGASLSWAAADDPGATSTFRYRAVGTAPWQALPIDGSGASLEMVDLDGIAAGDYEYEIVRTVDVSGNAVTSAATGGRFTIPVAGGSVVSRSLDVTQHNVVFGGTNDFGPVIWMDDGLRWTQAPQTGDTVTLRTRLSGTSTWTEQAVSGTGPDFTIPVTVTGSDVVEFEIIYTASGQSTPYLRAGGALNQTPAVSRTLPLLLLSQTAVIDTQPVPVEGLEYLLGLLSWTTPRNDFADTVELRVQPGGGAWQTLNVETLSDGFSADLRGLTSATYRFEIRYLAAGQSLPYAFTSGTFSTSSSNAGGGLTIKDNTEYSRSEVVRTQPDTPTTLQTYDRWGNVLTSTDAAGNTTNYRYDQSSAVIETRLPSVQVLDTRGGTVQTSITNPVFENHYDLLGRLIATRDANGNVSRGVYNAADQRVLEIAADGGQKAFVYDGFGDVVLSTDQLGFRTRNTYDRMGRLVNREREVQAGGLGSENTANAIVELFGYDYAGNRALEINGAGEVTRYSFNADGTLWKRSTNRGFTTAYMYDVFGNKSYERDANSLTMTWRFDGFGHLLSHVDLGGVTTSAEYNKAGLVIHQSSTRGQNQHFEYDAAGHLVRIVDNGDAPALTADAVDVNRITEYGYDIMGRRALERTINDGRVHQDSFTTFDAFGRIARVTDPDFEVTYSYDGVGNRTRINANYYNHIGKGPGNVQTQDLWYTYDAMNRVLISQGANIGGVVAATNEEAVTLTYDLKGERTSARMSGEHLTITRDLSGAVETGREYHRTKTGQYTEHYSYDGLGRLLATDTEMPTTSHQSFPNSYVFETITMRTSERQYDAASRETHSMTLSMDPAEDNDSALLTMTTDTTYDLDGRTAQQVTRQNGTMVTRVTFGDSVFHQPSAVQAVTSSGAREAVRSLWSSVSRLTASSSGGSGGGGVRVLYFPSNVTSFRGFVPRLVNSSGSSGYVTLPGYWSGSGWDAAGNLRGYTVETFKPSNGHFKYSTTHSLSYRNSDSYQQVSESMRSTGRDHPNDGTTTRTYNVNNELVQFSDAGDKKSNRYFVNNAMGQALTVVQGNFNGKDGHLTPTRAFDNALTRTGNKVKAQYYYFSQGENIGTFGQLADSEGTIKANFDVNYTPVSAQYPATTPGEVVSQQGDTLRSIASRVYGDSNLWYLIAEENGLSEPDAALVAGTTLTLPNRVLSLANDAQSFRPFDGLSILGDTTPTPRPDKASGLSIAIGIVVGIVVGILSNGAGFFTGPVSGNLAQQYSDLMIKGRYDWKGPIKGLVSALGFGGGMRDALNPFSRNKINAVIDQGITFGKAGINLGMFSYGQAEYWLGKPGSGSEFSKAMYDGLAFGGTEHPIDKQSVAITAAASAATFGVGVGSSFIAEGAQATGTALTAAQSFATNAYVVAAAGAVAGYSTSFAANRLLHRNMEWSWRDVATSALASMASVKGEQVARDAGGGQYWQSAAAGAGSVGVRLLRGGKMSAAEIALDVFGNAIANSVMKKSAPPPPLAETEQAASPYPSLDEMQANIAALGNLLDRNPSDDSGISMEENAARLAAGNSAIELFEEGQDNTGNDSANGSHDDSARKWEVIGENRNGKPLYSAAGPAAGTMQRITDGTRPYYDPNQHLPEWGPLTPYQNELGVMAWGYQDASGETHYVRMTDPSKETGIQGAMAGVTMAIGRTAGNYKFALAGMSAASERTPLGRAAGALGLYIGAASYLYLTGQRRYDTPASPFMQGDQVLPPVYVNPNNGPAMPWTEVFPADPQAGEPTILPHPASDQSRDDFVTSYPIADPLDPVYRTPIDQGVYLDPVMLSTKFPPGVNSVSDLTRLPLTQQITLDADLQQAIWDYNMGPAPGMIRHHLIVRQALMELPELMRKAAEGGFNIHGTNNGIVLDPTDHIGGHPEYNAYVLRGLRDIDLSLSNVEIAARVQGMSDTLRLAIKDGWVPRK